MILLNQKFPSCTLCGKRIPLRTEPVLIGSQKLCSPRCVAIAVQRDPGLAAEAPVASSSPR